MEPINEQLFQEILVRYNSGKASKEEITYLQAYYNLFDLSPEVLTSLEEERVKASIKLKIDERLNSRSKTARLNLKRFAAAAVILLALTASLYFALYRGTEPGINPQMAVDHAPGRSQATLTLADGKVIALGDASTGKIAQEAGASIVNTENGMLIYAKTMADEQQGTAQLNTITTPRGGQYQVVLADGTKVWLNAASSISYPTSFSAAARVVTLRGEAYFEVTKNKHAPFIVKTDFQEVQVLGTHFNVNAYDDEGITTTTLLEGAVRLKSGLNTKVLKPGEQALVNKNAGEIALVPDVDMEKVVAWKNGVFSFNNENLQSIMRQISRWYNVEVVYADNIPQEKYFGEISRNSKLSEVCKILELNNLTFEIDGRTLKVAARQ